jgi:hypothetical protein
MSNNTTINEKFDSGEQLIQRIKDNIYERQSLPDGENPFYTHEDEAIGLVRYKRWIRSLYYQDLTDFPPTPYPLLGDNLDPWPLLL